MIFGRTVNAIFFVTLLAIHGIAQEATREAFAQGKRVLDRSVNAYGGLAALNAITSVSITVEGESVHRNQSRKPDTFDRTPYTGEVIIDLKNARTFQTQRGQYPGGFNWHQGFVIDAGSRTSFDLIRKTANQAGPAGLGIFRASTRWLPQIVLLNVLERAESLRYIGTATYDRRNHDLIDFVSSDGARLTLYVDQKTGLLSKFETFITDRFAGDSVLETLFTGQREVNGRVVASGRVNAVNGEITNDFRIANVIFNAEIQPDQFKIPPGLRAVTIATPALVTKHSDGIYTTVAGGYNVLFADLVDHIFVMEAPGNDRVSQQAIQQIKKAIPGKPIKYLAVTHHHDDHAGGIRAYMAEGSALIVAPGERAFFEKVSKAAFTAEPDSFSLAPKPLKIEPLTNGKRVLENGNAVAVEIYDIGPGPHAEEMLVAYIPAIKAVFQGDLLNRPANGDYPIANETSAHFLKWIDSSGLVVETIIPVHGPVTTIEELRRAVADMKK